jgi:pyruvate-ferredoxin/flavodoxin oxidoreductase
MASGADTVVDYISNCKDEEIGILKINLYRPFDVEYFLKTLPKSVEKIAVLDRTKEQGSLGEPLYLDVCTAIHESKRNVEVIGGRYGLGGKEFNPAMCKAVFDNLKNSNKKSFYNWH